MKRYKIILLVLLLFLPYIVLQIYNNKYTVLENKICREDKAFATACDYPERLERYRTLSTNFYRHIGDQFGRSMGTSPPFSYALQASVPDADESSSQAERYMSVEIAWKEYEAQLELGRFNFSLFVAFTASVVVASVAATLLVLEVRKSRARPKS